MLENIRGWIIRFLKLDQLVDPIEYTPHAWYTVERFNRMTTKVNIGEEAFKSLAKELMGKNGADKIEPTTDSGSGRTNS